MDWRWRIVVRVAMVVVAMVVAMAPVDGARRQAMDTKGVIGLREVRLGTGSILQVLLDSQYSELVLYLDKVDMLEELEREVLRRGALTIFAPRNSFLEQKIDADLRRFLMHPGHENSLRSVLRYHIVSGRIEGADFHNRTVTTLCPGEFLSLQSYGLKRYADMERVYSPNSIVRKDGIVHGLDGFLLPPSVLLSFQEWKLLTGKASSKPRGSRRRRSSKQNSRYMLERANDDVPTALLKAVKVVEAATAVAPASPASPASSPGMGPSIAPAPGPGTAEYLWDDEDETLQFVTALSNYGGYSDMAELLVNATTLGMELGKLARQGYKLTILAPNDEAMLLLTSEQLNMPMEPLLYYHFLAEYQTEESMYNAVKRLGKQSYSTLRHPHKVVASESDGTVKFGDGEDAAHIFDHDIYVDGHISIQGISRVLAPPP